MSQTTDQSRGRASGPSQPRRGRSSGTSIRAGVPSPPRRRRPALTALAVLLIVGGAALAGWLALRMDTRQPVLILNQQVAGGQKITASMLSSTNVSGDGLSTIPTGDARQIIGTYARQTLYAHQLLSVDLLRKNPPLGVDQAQVGIPLVSGKYPPGLRPGDEVRLLRIGDSTTPSAALCTGLVLQVDQGKSGGLGSDQQASVATVLIPQSVSDLVVGATGSDNLGMALIARGVSIDNPDITALVQGKN